MAITADDYIAVTTALGGICFALTRRLPVAERQAICAARRFFSTWRRLWRRPWLAILSRKKKPSRAFVRARGRGKAERGETTTPGWRRWGCSAWTRSGGFLRYDDPCMKRHKALAKFPVGSLSCSPEQCTNVALCRLALCRYLSLGKPRVEERSND